MCGIVGFLDQRGGAEAPLGRTLLALLQGLACRGPDSVGVAVFGTPGGCTAQIKLPEGQDSARAASAVLHVLRDSGAVIGHEITGAYLRLELDGCAETACLERILLEHVPGAEVVSLGHSLRIVKQVGSPTQLEAAYGVSRWRGTHGIGHTRLSTESRVDLSHSQPFWAHGVADLATVHNGHITNYHKLRRRYEQQGFRFFTENDSEVIGVYLRDRLGQGLSMEDALRCSLDDFDGSFSYLAAWPDGLAYVRDRFGFKPLVVARTDDFVAIATEEIALRQALGRDFRATEPPPGTVTVWPVSVSQPNHVR